MFLEVMIYERRKKILINMKFKLKYLNMLIKIYLTTNIVNKLIFWLILKFLKLCVFILNVMYQTSFKHCGLLRSYSKAHFVRLGQELLRNNQFSGKTALYLATFLCAFSELLLIPLIFCQRLRHKKVDGF